MNGGAERQLGGDRFDSHDGRTVAAPLCVEHPPLKDWPGRNLALGTCPRCGCWLDNGKEVAREINARELVRALEDRDA
jgi:hypothetical protein